MLHGTDPDPYFIWKWDPNPCRPEKYLKCTTRTRRGPDHYSKVGPEPGWEDTDPTVPVLIGTYCTANVIKSINMLRKKKLFALTTVSSPLPDCDAYNPPCQYISIHVRLFLSLAVWNSLLNPLIIPASKVYLPSRRRMTNATSQFFFSSRVNFDCYVWTTITILFVSCNKDSEQLFFLQKNSQN